MSGSLIHDLIRRETARLRVSGKGYEASARAAVVMVEALHIAEHKARQATADAAKVLRGRAA